MSFYKRLLPATLAAAMVGGMYGSASAQKIVDLGYHNKEWSQDYQPFRIAGNLYYVGTYDLAVYLITTPQGHILINTGLADSEPLIRKHVKALGFKFSDIKILLATHAHFDHMGAMAAIKKETGARAMINEKDAGVTEDGGNSDYVFGGKGSTFLPFKADRLLHDHDTIQLGGMTVEMLHHPGHTKGASSFLFDVKDKQHTYRVLVANMPSVLEETNLAGMPGYPDVARDYAYTLNSLKGLQFDLWLSSHASQFGLHEKHKPGAPYNPEAFKDRAGYDKLVADLEQAYLKKLNSK
ncbi:MAG TPA: subclass B3 metallo-beta-lactamase [Chitinophaga sp.]|uniref:subclass B3 metallo-beta-lactamase n=1 Tax=Chitinophaga sp. TaxID=1869181 RepID=UPI002CC7BDD8|nr:subclass B3 metallo-beta-lactamase [Chitinophaga sp.]HVI45070.1 subclass B3 metallo-beta-lactamase [Chitinophaga sp.]